MRIPISKPVLGTEEREAALRVLESGVLAKGACVEAFEAAFAAYHGARHAVAMSSGTSALTAALIAHGIGQGDEVIVPSFSFFATASAVLATGARPVFGDIDPQTYCLAPASAEAAIGARTKAIVPVHLYGLPANLPVLEALCRRHGLVLVEDAAQAHGAASAGRRVGSTGTAAFSFYATKNMTTLEGGMVLTSDSSVASTLRMRRNHGRDERGRHVLIGGNFRMSELAAAIGSVQLARLPALTQARIDNARYYDRHLARVGIPHVPDGLSHVFHQYTIRVREPLDRERMRARLLAHGVEARVYYSRPIHCEPALEFLVTEGSLELPETERASREVLSLPVHAALTAAELRYVVETVNGAL